MGTPAATEDKARNALKRAEDGDPAAAATLAKDRQANPAFVDAVEQEAAEAPEGRGLSR